MKKILFFFFVFSCIRSSAQKIYGIVLNDQGDLLPYSSVTIKGSTMGASANINAKFSINVSPGVYTVVCQHIGYAAQEKQVVVNNGDEEISFVLKAQQLTMNEVVVKNKGENPAYAIIRQAIKKRSYYKNQLKSFECDLYSKGMLNLRNLPDKIWGQKINSNDKRQMGVDSTGKGIIYLSESMSKISSKLPDKFKMEVISSRVSGSGSLGFTFPAFISFYDNNVTIFKDRLNPRGFISPIADGAIHFYKYKLLGSFWEDGKKINSIKVMPRRNYEPLFSGVINITDGDWRIHSVDLLLTTQFQLQVLDTLQITQFYLAVNNDIWQIKNQLLHFDFNQLGINLVGNFLYVYSDYKVDPTFAKKFFNNVIIKYDTGVNKKTKLYWDSIRPVPLEKEEALDYEVKDSIYEIHKDAVWTQHDIDSLRKEQGKLKLYKVAWSSVDRVHYSLNNTYDWGMQGLLPVLEYNPAEGIAVTANGYFKKTLKSQQTDLYIQSHIRYGFANTHLNAWFDVDFRERDISKGDKLKRQNWLFSGGKQASQFNKEYPVSPFNNSISTLFWGNNYMKLYENYFGSATYNRKFETGLRFGINALYEDRIPLNNTTNFTLFKKDRQFITPDYPYQITQEQFIRHQAFIISVDINFKPGQKYIQLPDDKIPIASKFPTFMLNYTKGIKDILGSNVDFDKWKFTVKDDVNLKLAGVLKYQVSVGGFLNDRSVYIQDYQHFNANRSIVASDYVNSFQLMSYFTNSTTNNFFSFANVEHHFNGLLTNKIPLIKKLGWNLVVGANALYVDKNNSYAEIFAGLENIFKLFRVDYIVAYQNNGTVIRGVCIGTGGIIGDHINVNSFGSNATFHF